MSLVESGAKRQDVSVRSHYFQRAFPTGKKGSVVTKAAMTALRWRALPESGPTPAHLQLKYDRKGRRIYRLEFRDSQVRKLLGTRKKGGVTRLIAEIIDDELVFLVDMRADALELVKSRIRRWHRRVLDHERLRPIRGVLREMPSPGLPRLAQSKMVGRAEVFAGLPRSEEAEVVAGLMKVATKLGWKPLPNDYQPDRRSHYREHDILVIEGRLRMGGGSPQPVFVCLYPRNGDPTARELKMELKWTAKHLTRWVHEEVAGRAMRHFLAELVTEVGVAALDVREWSETRAVTRNGHRQATALHIAERDGWVDAETLAAECRRTGDKSARMDKPLKRLCDAGLLGLDDSDGRRRYKLQSPLALARPVPTKRPHRARTRS